MYKDNKIWDRFAKRYAQQPIEDEISYQKKLTETQRYFTKDTEVLEIGCGTGSTALIHAPFVKHINAIDFSQNMIEIAQKKAVADKVTNISFNVANIDDLPEANHQYDAILALSVLHLLKDKEATLKKIHSLLKPNGVFISSTVCIGDKAPFLKYLFSIGQVIGLLPTLKTFKQQELTSTIVTAGFAIDHQWQPANGKAVFVIAKKI